MYAIRSYYGEIWVAAGTYKPTTTADRAISFSMPNGVKIYGGFAGTESTRDQRNWETNKSILSGDIGSENDNTDNSYHVIKNSSWLDETAVLDGFTITGGKADGGDWADRITSYNVCYTKLLRMSGYAYANPTYMLRYNSAQKFKSYARKTL